MRERGAYDRETIYAILDAGLVCHVAFVEDGAPCVLPVSYARLGDQVYFHGAPGNRMLRALVSGADCCVAVTLLDGLVLARSAQHHSVNYRSVVAFGRGRLVDGADEKQAALAALLEAHVPGRSADCRPPTAAELRAVRVVAFPLDEASAKARTGGPSDGEDDMGLPYWAGVLPLTTLRGTPEPCADLRPGTPTPPYVAASASR